MNRIGTIDIETYPGKYRSFANNMYETSLMREDQPVKLASFSVKPLGGKPYTRGEWQYKNYRAFVKDMHAQYLKYDYLIAHNGKKFDLRQSNAFFADMGLPKTEVKIIDTKNEVKRNFNFPSYSLKYVLVRLGIGYKLETGGEALWFDTEAGKPKSRKLFLEYNENDTVKTEELFLFLVKGGWTKMPGRTIYVPGEGCVRCGKENMQSRGDVPRAEGFVHGYMCKECGKRNYTEVFKRYETRSLSRA